MYGGGFLPSHLFLAGEQGVWYDPSDVSTLFQDSAGTTPVTADGDPVGLMLDKSKGLVLGPELSQSAEFGAWENNVSFPWGTFTDNGGSLSLSNATEITSVATHPDNINVVVGRSYSVIVPIEHFSGTYDISIRNNPTQTSYVSTAQLTSGGDISILFKPTVTESVTIQITSRVGSGVQSLIVGSVSVKELPGNHATQSTSAARPTYQRGDSRGVVNQLKWSEDFGNAVWSKNATTLTSDVTTFFDGTIDADEITDNAANTVHGVLRSETNSAGETYTFSLFAQASGSDILFLGSNIGGEPFAYFDLTAGTVGTKAAGVTANIADQGGGVYRCSITATVSSSPVRVAAFVAQSDGTISYVGDGSRTINIGGYQLETGSTATPYQRNDSHLGGIATGSSTDLHWLKDDKVDDVMTATMPAMPTATVATSTDDGVVITYPVNIPAGAYSVDTTSTLGFDYGRLIVDRALTASESTSVTTYLSKLRGGN